MALPKASDNPYPSVLVVEGTTPASPSAGDQRLFIDSADHKLKRVNSGGTVTTVEGGSAAVGSGALIFRYTVTGAVKASIDTGVDTADAGSNDWTNANLLEIWLYARTDEAVASSIVDLTFNNDTGANYDKQLTQSTNTTLSASSVVAQTSLQLFANGASRTANFFSTWHLTFPNFSGTTGYKVGTATIGLPDATAANQSSWVESLNYRSTSAITRLKVIPDTAAKNFAIGTQLLIYKRTAS